MDKLRLFFEYTRAYALPMSVTAWAVAFAFGISNNGNILYGIVALFGIICAHLGANLFDDIIDYKKYCPRKIRDKEQSDVNEFFECHIEKVSSDGSKARGGNCDTRLDLKSQKKEQKINLKKGKCKCFLNGELSVGQAFKICFLLFGFAALTGLFFAGIYKLPILIIMGITGILCLIYPVSGYLGLSEIIIGTIFSPLLFTGVYYVMTGMLSAKLLLLSVSFALVTVCLLYTDFYLDYNTDKEAGKKTLPVLCTSKQNAYYFYIFIIFLIYANLFIGIHGHIFPLKYSIIFLSVFPALSTIGRLQKYIDKEIKDEKEFLGAMNNAQKFAGIFAILCVISCF